MLHESGADGMKCFRKVASDRKIADMFRSLVRAGSLRLECVKVLNEGLQVPV